MKWDKKRTSSTTSFREQAIYYYLSQFYNSIILHFKNLGVELDVYLPIRRIAFEYDGFYWHRKKQEYDDNKDRICINANIKLIRFRESGLAKTDSADCYEVSDIKSFEHCLKDAFRTNLQISPNIDLIRDAFEILKQYKPKVNTIWYKHFTEAQQYFKQNGNLEVPLAYICPSGFKLGKWIAYQNKCYTLHKLDSVSIELLSSIAMVWKKVKIESSQSIFRTSKTKIVDEIHSRTQGAIDATWNKFYDSAANYWNQNNSLRVPLTYIDDKGLRLGQWIRSQRGLAKKNDEKSKWKVKLLSDIGMVWNTYEDLWSKGFNCLIEYHKEYGNIDVPKNCIYKGFKLGLWVNRVRQKKNLSSDKVAELNRLGMIWNHNQNEWERMYIQVLDYFNTHGSVEGIPEHLSDWLSNQKNLKNKKKLSKTDRIHIQKLDKIRICWDSRADRWDKNIALLTKYFTKHGTTMLPDDTVIEGVNLASWCEHLRQLKKKGDNSLTEERIKQLDSIGFMWEPTVDKWFLYYNEAVKYYEENQSLDIPWKYESNGLKLGTWIITQRENYRKKSNKAFTQKRIELLNNISMIWDIQEYTWQKYYSEAYKFYKENGNINIPKGSLLNGLDVYNWIIHQRQYIKGKRSNKKFGTERINMLREIGLI